MGLSFSVIAQDKTTRALVQDGLLARKFLDGLFPNLLFMAEAEEDQFEGNVGDSKTFTGKGLLAYSTAPMAPRTDPNPRQNTFEQWSVQMQKWADSVDSDMPSSTTAAASLFLSNSHDIGLLGGRTMNAITRNVLFNAGLSGHTNIGATVNSTTVRVLRLNGFTTARRPDLAAGSAVAFAPVSASNPLAITIKSGGGDLARNVVGFTPDVPGDEIGPGTLTLDAAANVTARDAVIATDRTFLVRSGGGFHVDDIASNDLLKLSDIRTLVGHMRDQSVREYPDGGYHLHLDSTGEGQLQSDAEWRSLLTAMPNDFRFAEFAIGRAAGTVAIRNSQMPRSDTVIGGSTASYATEQKGGQTVASDNFGGEVWSNGNASTGVKVRRALVTAPGGLTRYSKKRDDQITEAGVTGKVGKWNIDANGMSVNMDNIDLVIRAPIDALQEQVRTSYVYQGNWVERTDAATGDASRYKRVGVIEFGEA